MFFIIFFAVVILDQATKLIVRLYLQPESIIPVINNFFYLNYYENQGAAFGILKSRKWMLIVVAVAAIGTACYYIYKNRELTWVTKYSIALIIGGATGNLIDRVALGYVVDFFDFSFFPVFNIADVAVITGTAVLMFVLLFGKQKRARG